MNAFRSAMKAGLERGKALFKGITNGDFTVNEAREEIATVVREARASGKSPKDIVAMLKDNHQLRQMAEVVFGGLNEFDWQHKVETLKNSSESSVWDHASIGSVEDLVEKLNLDRKVADLRWNMIPSGTQDILRPHLHKLTKGKENSDTDLDNEISKVFKCNRCGSPIETTRSGYFCSKCEDFIPDNEITDTRKNLHDDGPLEAITEGVENAQPCASCGKPSEFNYQGSALCGECYQRAQSMKNAGPRRIVRRGRGGDNFQQWEEYDTVTGAVSEWPSKEIAQAAVDESNKNFERQKKNALPDRGPDMADCELCGGGHAGELVPLKDTANNVWFVCKQCASNPAEHGLHNKAAEYPHDIFNTKNPGLKRGAAKYGVDPNKKGE